MNRKPNTFLRSFSLCTAILCLLLAAPAAFCAPAEQFKFTFNPPDGLRATETHKTVQVLNLGRGMISTQSYWGKDSLRFTRSQGSYLVTRTSISSDCSVTGRDAAYQGHLTQIVNLLKQAPITYQLDQGGDCTRVYGIEEFIKGLERKNLQGPAGQVAASLRGCQDALTQQAIWEWNGLIAPFTYRSARVGDVWKTSLESPMPAGGAVTVAGKISFLGWVSSGGRRWMKVKVDSACSDSAAMRRYLGKMYGQMALTDAQRAALPKFTAMSFKGSDVRLIDPSTMLYLKQTMSQDIAVTMVFPGYGKRTMVMKQTIARSLSYSDLTVASR